MHSRSRRLVVRPSFAGAAISALLAGCGGSVQTSDPPDAGIRVSPMSGPTSEGGGQAAFTIVLRTKPSEDVTILMSSTDTNEAVLSSGGQVTFEEDDWDVPQTVFLTGVDDDVADGTKTAAVTFNPTQSADSDYHELLIPDLAVVNLDDEVAAIDVDVDGGAVSEAGLDASFTVVLRSRPTSVVRIPVSTTDDTEGVPETQSLEFLPDEWDIPQTVLVEGVADDVPDGNVAFQVVFGEIETIDSAYESVVLDALSFVNIDDDTPGIAVVQNGGFVTEDGTSQASFTVVLATEPSADVTLGLGVDDATEGAVDAASLTFTSADYDVPRTVTVTGEDDDIVDGLQPFSVIFMQSASMDPDYDGMQPAALPFNNADDEEARVVVSPVNGLVTESGATAQFSVVLTAEPATPIDLFVSITDDSEAVLSTGTISFSTANWDTPQSVLLSPKNDLYRDGHQAFRVVFSPDPAGDPVYAGTNPVEAHVSSIDDGPVANVLIFDDGPATFADDAAGDLMLNATIATSTTAFDTALSAGGWDVVVWEASSTVMSSSSEAALSGWIASGGKAIIGHWDLGSEPALAAGLGVSTTPYTTYRPVHFGPMVRDSVIYGDLSFRQHTVPSLLTGVPLSDGSNELMLVSSASSLVAARLDNTSGPIGIAITNDNQTIVHGFSPDDAVGADRDSDLTRDVHELYVNELLQLLDPFPPLAVVDGRLRFDNSTPLDSVGSDEVTSPIEVSGVPVLPQKVVVSLYFPTTPDMNDFAVRLISPTGDIYDLSTFNPSTGNGDGYGTACAPDSSRTTFDGDAAMPITGGTPPYVGSFRPEESLAPLAGVDPNGTWQLEIDNSFSSDDGTLECWSLIFPVGTP